MVNDVILTGEAKFDPFEEQRKVFSLVGDLLHRFPEAVNANVEMKNELPSDIRLQTELATASGELAKKATLSVNVYDMQTSPEIRMTLSQGDDATYHVRVNATPTNEDFALSDVMRALGKPFGGTSFRDNYGETTMPVGWAIDMLSAVTNATRPFHDFGDVTFKDLSTVLRSNILKGLPPAAK